MYQCVGNKFSNCKLGIHTSIFSKSLTDDFICRQLTINVLDKTFKTDSISLNANLFSLCFYFISSFINNDTRSLSFEISELAKIFCK